MAKKEKNKLEQTKGKFQLIGIVSGVNSSRAYREGTTGKGKDYRSLSFNVKTSPTNNVRVELFGMEQDWVYPYSSTDKKSQKTPFKDRFKLPDSYHLIGVNTKLEVGDDGKLISDSLHEFDAVDYIHDNLKDGDSVYVFGEFDFSTYEDRQGNVRNQTRYTIKSIGKLETPVDFNKEDFKEQAHFEQEIVINELEVDKKEKRITVYAYAIAYGEKFAPAVFTIDGNRNEKMFTAFPKFMKFGDLVKVYGQCISTAIVDEDEDDDPFGSETNPLKRITGWTQELLITGLDYQEWKDNGKGKYTQDDFVVEEAVKNYGDEDDEDPFADDGDGDEGLPWD